MRLVYVPVPIGELADRITILRIKEERILEPEKHREVLRNLNLLEAEWTRLGIDDARIRDVREDLARVNARLWDIEDRLRAKEARRSFDAEFVELARAVYRTNDERHALKAEIDRLSGSQLTEAKSYAAS